MTKSKRLIIFSLFIITVTFPFQTKALSNLDNLFKQIQKQPISSTHPDYPIAVIQKAIQAEQTNKTETAIKLLENLREQVLFDMTEKNLSAKEKMLLVGTYGSFKLWRELAYIILGRAYYSKKWYTLAIEIFQGIPDSSIFLDFKKIGLGWAYLATNQLSSIEQLLKSPPLNSKLKIEHVLQTALFKIRKGQFKEGFSLSESIVTSEQELSSKMRTISFKIFAEAGMRYWLANSNSWNFKQNLSILQKVIQVSKKIKLNDCDGDCLFFIAEAWWNLASLYRVQDPVKYQAKWQAALQKANGILSPLVAKSLKTQQALLSEEAFFLSIAISWELNNMQESIPRLKIFPKLYPMGKYKEDIYQLLGDYYFDRKRYQTAINFYRKLVKIGNSEKSAYGIYKAAWAFYNNNQRWEALRHIERLLLYFDKTTQQPGEESSILKEAKRDMLLFLAELMPATKSLQEFNLFNYSKTNYLSTSEELALTYKRIGKYADAIEVFKTLLIQNPEKSRSFYWLEELIDTQLRQGKREQIADSFQLFYPGLPGEQTTENNRLRKQLINRFVKVILTIHREARKTSTKRNWEAVDKAYDVFNQFFQTHSDGNIWYHGAQRFEQREKSTNAIKWYQRSALIKSFSNHLDAAQSVLRIIKDKSERLELEQEKTKQQHLHIANVAQWYIDHFSNTPQRDLADHIYIEQMYRAGNFSYSADHLKLIFKEQQATSQNINKLQLFYSILERKKEWEKINQLASFLLEILGESKSSFVSDLKQMQQESAFQQAFFTGKDKDLARKWYKKAIKYNYNPETTLKSWHNYLISFSLPREVQQLIAEFGNFPSIAPENEESKRLLHAIKIHMANAYFHLKKDLQSAQMAIEAAELVPSNSNIELLLFNAMITLGQHGDLSAFERQLNKLQALNSSLVKTVDNQVFIARLYLWNNQLKKSWQQLFPLLQKKISQENVQFLVRDLFFLALRGDDPIKQEIIEWLLANKKELKKQIALTGIWDNLVPSDQQKEITKWEKLEDIPESLTKRAEIIKKVLSRFNDKQQQLSSFIKHAEPLQQVKAICDLPTLRGLAIENLTEIRDAGDHDNSTAANSLNKRLTTQIEEYIKLKQKEQDFCKTQLDKTVYLPSSCIWNDCLVMNNNSPQEISSSYIEILQDYPGLQDQIYHLIDRNIHSLAYKTAALTDNKDERLFIYAMIRLAHGDSWNGSLILKELTKSQGLKSQARLLLAWLAYKQKNIEIAKTHMVEIDRSQLNEWQIEILEEIDL